MVMTLKLPYLRCMFCLPGNLGLESASRDGYNQSGILLQLRRSLQQR